MWSVCGREGTSLLSAPQLIYEYVVRHSDTWTEYCRMGGDDMAMRQCSSSHLIFYYIPLYLTDMEPVNNIMQCIKHSSYHTINEN